MDNQMNQYDNGGGYNNGNRGNGQGGNNGGNNNQPPKKPNWMMILLAGLSTLMIVMLFWNIMFGTDNSDSYAYTEFLDMLEDGKIETAQVQSNGQILFTLKEDAEENKTDTKLPAMYPFYAQQGPKQYSTYLMEDLDTLTQRLDAQKVKGDYKPADNSGRILDILLYVVLPLILMWVLLGFLFRKMSGGGGPMGVGKSNAKVYVQKETGVTFKDVAGEDEAKESLVEVVDFLHNPAKYSKIGAKLPKGALLVGPPGTGKTLLAKAVAGEAHVPFFSLTGSDFIELYVGVGASRVRDLFKEATKNAPCIIFIDEIDAIGRSRDSKYGGGNEEREQTLNQLLSEMDGFDSSKGILILGATNRPEILDKALLRPGRFDRRIIVDKPDLKGRVEILKVHAKDVKMDDSVDLDAIALATSGAVGSDLANMINEAAINAVKEGRQYVTQKDLFTAVEQVLVGKEKKDRIMSKEERRIVSYHEVGHALVSALQKNSEPVQKITIVPRTMGALGYVMHVPEEEKYLNTEAELRDMLVGLVAGRAAEEVVFDTVTTGAANDIERATAIAKAMVTQYGMSKKFGLIGLATVESQYLEGRAALNCSDRTAAEIDTEVVAILKESYDKALALLSENRELMDKLAEFLIEKETITGKEFMEIFRREKGIPEPQVDEKEAGDRMTASAPSIHAPGSSIVDETLREARSARSAMDEDIAVKPNQSSEESSEYGNSGETLHPSQESDVENTETHRPSSETQNTGAQFSSSEAQNTGIQRSSSEAQNTETHRPSSEAQNTEAHQPSSEAQDKDTWSSSPEGQETDARPGSDKTVGRFSNRPLD